MPSKVIDGYKPCYSQEIQRELSSNHAKDFVLRVAPYAKRIFLELEKHLPDTMVLEFSLLGVALNSAYIEMFVATQLHELEGGPSPDKHAAAVASWINRIKPIQFPSGIARKEYVYLNSHFALLTGLLMKFGLEKRKGILHEVLAENKAINELIYVMVWRNPSYRELTTLFRFI